MTGRFLIIEVGDSRIQAFAVDDAVKKGGPAQAFCVLRRDLPNPVEDEGFFDSALDLLSGEMDFKTASSLALLLPSRLFFFRRSELPFKTKAKVRQVLPLELRPTFPMENEACLTDFFIPDAAFTEGLTPVFSASAKESDIKSYYDGLMRLNLKPAILAPAGITAAACFLKTQKDADHFVFLDRTDDDITATLVFNRMPVLARTFSPDGMTPEDLRDEARRMILGFQQRTGLDTPFDIFVSGAGEGEFSREALFQSALSPNREIPGLFNFCRGRYGSDSFFKRHAPQILSAGILAGLVFILLMTNIYGRVHGLEKARDQRKQIIASIFAQTFPDKKAGNTDPFLLMQSLVKQSAQSKGTPNPDDPLVNHKGIDAVKIIFELSQQIPKSVDAELSTLMLENNRMVLTGTTENFNTVDQLKGLIEKSPLFKKVDISSAAAGKNMGRVDFKFMVEL